ncbi:MAG: phosphatase PAP2 family protein [Prevotellaceae bacterium]|jgi:membrane-associated phospholipid phosphatase|nr:phosphatase PAP2 family protein [Prevotellaceae bacterium]
MTVKNTLILKKTVSTIWKSLFPVEKLSIVYAFLTALFIIVFGAKDSNTAMMILYRILFIALIFALRFLYKNKATNLIWFARNAVPVAFIAYWYPETYFMNENIFGNLDTYFVDVDQFLFGCQPSLEFSKYFPQTWINELMNFGYISYYLIIMLAIFTALAKNKKYMQHTAFIILCAFFIYYITFIIFPVVGPQFYFNAPDNMISNEGFFRNTLVELQAIGEKPTGAFPSSHVGICLICMYFIFKYSRKIFYILIPVAFVLICSTVYLKAHYLIDVIGGFATAPVYFWISKKIQKLNFLK